MKRLSYKQEVERLKGVLREYEQATKRTVFTGEVYATDEDAADAGKLHFTITAPLVKDEDKFVQLVALQVAQILKVINVQAIKNNDLEIPPDGEREPDEPEPSPEQAPE